MPLPKISEARELSAQELNDQIAALKRELFELRLQKATQRLEKPHLFKQNRHRLAQLMTVEQERRREDSAASTSSSTS
jgi:large subunit ribosomal protein L29